MKQYLAIFAVFLAPSISLAAGQSENTSLHYTNQRGSELTITLHKESRNAGTVTGTFKTAVAGKDCQRAVGKSESVTGFYAGNAITLSISYPHCGSAVAIVGNFDKKNNIETMWMLAKQGRDSDGENWNNRLVGYDKYQIIPK